MSLDCEMDVLNSSVKTQSLLCRLSLVNSNGEVVLDSLVDYRTKRLKKMARDVRLTDDSVIEIESKIESLAKIHGIESESLKGAPKVKDVKAEVERLIDEFEKKSGEKVILVGHSVVNDIEALGLAKARYIDTTNIRHKSDQKGKIRKLKDLVKEFLKFEI